MAESEEKVPGGDGPEGPGSSLLAKEKGRELRWVRVYRGQKTKNLYEEQTASFHLFA